MKRFLYFILLLILCCCGTPTPPSKRGRIDNSFNRPNHNHTSKPSSSQNNQETDVVVGNNKVLSGSEIFRKYNSAVFIVYSSTVQGSGFFVSSDGTAVSNYHVFDGQDIRDMRVKVGDNEFSVERVMAKSYDEDWIVFKVRGNKRFHFIPISDSIPAIGSKVYAIGSPLGLENTLSSGEVSQLRDNGNIIQISVPIDHGSSGGALIDEYGFVIGITTAGMQNTTANLNFAVNIDLLRRYL